MVADNNIVSFMALCLAFKIIYLSLKYYCLKPDNAIFIWFGVFESIKFKENVLMLNCKHNIHVCKAQFFIHIKILFCNQASQQNAAILTF